MLLPVRSIRYPTHDLDPAHLWPAPGQAVSHGPITVRPLDNGQWFVEDGRHRLIRALLRGDVTIEASLVSSGTPHP